MQRALPSLRRFPLGSRRIAALASNVGSGGETGGLCVPSAFLTTQNPNLSTSAGAFARPSTSSKQSNGPTSAETQAALFDLLRQRLCSPTHPLPIRSVYDELANRSRVVEDFHFAKTSKRIARQCVALSFLRRYNVLLHSLYFFSENTQTWNITPQFERLALLGESILATEVRGRLLKLFPDIPFSLMVEVLNSAVGEDGLNRAFDRYNLKTIVGAKPQDRRSGSRFTSEQKCHMLCAVIGEMYWFVARTRPTDRTHNNAVFPPSDVLILHVLCAHLLECIPAELIYGLLEPVVAEVKKVWVNAPLSVPSQLRLIPRTIGALSLNAAPLPNASLNTDTAAQPGELRVKVREAQSARRPLSRTPDANFVKSYMQPAVNHRNFDSARYQVEETDDVVVKSVLTAKREPAPGDVGVMPGGEAALAARAMELAKLALQQSS